MPADDAEQPILPPVAVMTHRQLREHMKEMHEMPASSQTRREQIVNVHLLLHRAEAANHTHERY